MKSNNNISLNLIPFKNAKDAALVLDNSYNIKESNKSIQSLYGCTHKYLIGKNISELIHSEEKNKLEEKIKLTKSKKGVLFESKGLKIDGTIFPVVISINPFMIDKKKHFLCIIRDNTLYEKILNKKEQQINTYRKVADNFPDIICRLNKKHKIIYINPVIEQLLNKKPDQILGKSFFEIGLTKKVSNNADKLLSFVFNTGKENFLDFIIKTNSGTRLFNTRFIPEISSKGNVETILGIIRDVTEIRKLDEARNVLASIVEYSDDAIIAKTLSGKIVSWNKGAEKIYGYRSEEVINKNVDLIIPEDKKKEQKLLLQKVREGKGIENHETERIRKDGVRINVSVTFSPIKDKKGKATGISVIARDITRQKIIEKEYKVSEEKFRSIAENIQEVFYIRERDSQKRTEKMAYVSQAYEEVWQKSTIRII